MKSVVIGSGPVGLGLLYALCRVPNSSTVLVCRSEDTKTRVSQYGVRVVSSEHDNVDAMYPDVIVDSITSANAAVDSLHGEGPVVYYVCTKVSSNPTVIKELMTLPNVDNVCVCQNGYAPELEFSEALALQHGAMRVVVNRASTIVENQKELVVKVFNSPVSYRSDNYVGGRSPMAAKLAEDITKAGYVHIYDEAIQHRSWRKSVLNCAVNPPCALARARIGDLLTGPARETIESMVEECLSIGTKHGIEFGENYIEKLFGFLDTVSEHYPSMVKDIEAGRETEIGALNMYIAQLSSEDTPAPLNRAFASLIANIDRINTRK